MLLGFPQSLALLLVICLFYGMDTWLIRRFDQLRAHGSSRSWSYTLLAWLAAVLIILQPWLLSWLGLRIAARWGLLLQILGAIITAGGLLLHGWARLNLGQYYGEREEVQPGQALVFKGPYKKIRHPIYMSYFLSSIGMFLINPALPTLLGVIYSFWDFPRAMHREEKLLAQQLPGYAEYMRTTPAFLPRLGKRPEQPR
jgi:protein-S-isoprenylcysteine O-methyltransferase Ste14